MTEDKMIVVLGCVGLLAVALVATVLHGWALALLWAWFVVPVFGLPTLTYLQAIGLALVFSMFVTTKRSSETKQDTWEGAVASLLTPFLVVGMGWILTMFM